MTGPERFADAVVPPLERARLEATLGAELARAREAAGYTYRPPLARAAGCSVSMLRNLETGQRRPRRSLLATLAAVLAPDDPDALLDVLVAAAGGSLRPDTPSSLQRRRNAVERVTRARRRAQRAAAAATARIPSAAALARMSPERAHAALVALRAEADR